MARVGGDDTVRIHYTGKLKDGSIFDSSVDRAPLEFTLGTNQVITGFEEGVLGMQAGDKKTVTIPPEEAYGHPDERLVYTIDRTQVPADLPVAVGEQLQMNPPDGDPMIVSITAVTDDTVTLDANHPLAGQTLIFDLELVEIV